MTSVPKKSTEAEDVLEFLNSLPETDNKPANAATKASVGATAAADSDDIMEFLDELEATDKSKPTKATKSKKVGINPEPEILDAPAESEEPPAVEPAAEEDEVDNLPDPVAAISSWWSSSGSATVSSFWNNAKQEGQKAFEEASKLSQKAQEEATKLAAQAKLDEHVKKLQNLQLDEDTKKRILNAGDEIDPSKALGFFTKNFSSVLSSIISTDEVLKISVVHDLENYYVESIISKSFKKVMKQVQGGIAIELVTNTAKDHNKRNLNIFEGKPIDGEKLALANLETAINGAKSSAAATDEVRFSNLFISILPIKPFSKEKDEEATTIDTSSSNAFHFLIILKDTTNNITIVTKSQAFPLKWATWLDGSEDTPDKDEDEGVDPSEWVKGWVYDGLALSFGVLAQSYVVKRMGYD